MKKQNNTSNNQPEEIRAVDKSFELMDQTFSLGNKGLYAFFLFFSFFGVMALIWMIPFPQFDFLIKMNAHTFLNWGSFFIAIVIYLYLKLAPTLSYAVLFCISVMSYFIVQLEYVEKGGGPSVILIGAIISFVSLLGLWLSMKKEKALTINDFLKFLTLGPVWLWSKVFQKLNIKY